MMMTVQLSDASVLKKHSLSVEARSAKSREALPVLECVECVMIPRQHGSAAARTYVLLILEEFRSPLDTAVKIVERSLREFQG